MSTSTSTEVERLRREIADLRAALSACARTGVAGAVIAALADGELTSRELARMTGRPYWSCKYQINSLVEAGIVEPAYEKPSTTKPAIAYRLTGAPT